MKIKLYFLVIITCKFLNVHAQWNEVIPHPNLINSWSIFFINDSTGFIGGMTYDTIAGNVYHNSRILKTADWGVTWNDVFHASLDSNASANLDPRGIYFTTALKGYIVGGNYKILRTFDGGNTWQVQTVSAGMSYSPTILFTDTLTGYVANQWELNKTSDGGDTWELDTAMDCGGALDLSFPSKHVGFSTNCKTTDGAENWELFSAPGLSVFNIDYANDNLGLMVGQGQNGNPVFNYGRIARTTDGAQTWTSYSFNQEFSPFTDVQFVNDSDAYLIGGGNLTNKPFWKSIDEGITLYQQQVNHSGTYPGSPYCLHCPSEQVCYVGCYGSNKVYRTTNGGGPLIGLGIGDEVSQKNELSIYPNPTNNELNLNLNYNKTEIGEILIYNAQGILVVKENVPLKTGQNIYAINTTTWSAGIYFVSITSSNVFKVQKVVKN
jgi:photosystem II stability/assembly factor-like uncharacterized protein